MKRLRRRIRIACLAACFLAMLACALAWTLPRTTLLYPFESDFQRVPFTFQLSGGRLLFQYTNNRNLLAVNQNVVYLMTSENGRPAKSVGFWGLSYRVDIHKVPPGTIQHLSIPLWMLIVIAGLYPASIALLVLLRYYRLRRRDPAAVPCPKCGYDLRATKDRCPECGAVKVDAASGSTGGAP